MDVFEKVRPRPHHRPVIEVIQTCPLCGDPATTVTRHHGIQYRDPLLGLHRYGTGLELGPPQRWEQVWPCPEFDMLIVVPCGHRARGAQAHRWWRQMTPGGSCYQLITHEDG